MNGSVPPYKWQGKLDRCRQRSPDPRRFRAMVVERAYRFIRMPSSVGDWEPIAQIDQTESTDPSHWALSFFISLEAAIDRWGSLSARLGLVAAFQRYGTHVGEIRLDPTDGVMSEPGVSGHFELHESSLHAAFEQRVVNYTPLPMLDNHATLAEAGAAKDDDHAS